MARIFNSLMGVRVDVDVVKNADSSPNKTRRPRRSDLDIDFQQLRNAAAAPMHALPAFDEIASIPISAGERR
jgi:hypothetical protein